MKNKIRQMKGFTLVELLIVIALIAILSVAVLATINPIEQSNKARDAKFKNDAAEVMNAYERFYASQNKYPWNMDYSNNGIIDGDEVVAGTNGIAFFSRDWRFGIMDLNGTTTTNSQLISTSELKSAFAGKEPFVSTVTNGTSEDAMYVYHSSDSNYVCFCPKANANRTGDVAANLKCLTNVSTVGNAAAAAVISNIGPNCVKPDAAQAKITTFCTLGGNANLLCVPEGTIAP